MRASKRVTVGVCASLVVVFSLILWRKRSDFIAIRNYEVKEKRAEDKCTGINAQRTAYELPGEKETKNLNITACNLKNLLSESFTISDLKHFQENCQITQYNRCMKSGSSLFIGLISSLSMRHNVGFITKEASNNYFPVKQQRVDALHYTNTSHRRPLVIAMHRFFIQYHDFNIDQPFLINVVRHPIGRTISHYYFQTFRMPAEAETKLQLGVVPMGTLEDCARGINELYMCNVFFGYFCEDQEVCRKRDEYSLVKAKKNIEEYGMIVGITEEFYGFMEVLEILYPRLFEGVCALYNSSVEDALRRTSNFRVQNLFPLPPTVASKLPYILRTEIELYEFIRQRYYAIRKKVFTVTLS